MTKKICFSIYRATTFLAEIFFPGGTQPKWKINEILEGRGFDKHLLEWKFQGRGGLKQKRHPSSGYGYFLGLHNLNLLLANSLLIFCRSCCSHRCHCVSFQLIMKHHNPNERQKILKILDRRIKNKTKQQKQQQQRLVFNQTGRLPCYL